MIAYSMVGTRDLAAAKAFYDAFMPALDAKHIMGTDRVHFYGNGPGNPMFAICIPYDKAHPHPGNGAMTAFACMTRDAVDAAHAKALELGCEDEGGPGERGPGGAFYLAYFRDPDGNKMALFTQAKDGA